MTDTEYLQRTDRYLALIESHKNTIFWLCFRYARFRRDRTLDYQQDVLERLWRTLDTLPPDSSHASEQAWVRMQARSALGARLRDIPPSQPLPLDAVKELPVDNRQQEYRELLDELMVHLPAADHYLLLQQCRGYSADELARELGITPDAVHQRLTRARQRLRKIYEQLYYDQQ